MIEVIFIKLTKKEKKYGKKVFIKKFTKKYIKIYLFRQKSKGFMQGCFESIKYVKSKYCTFLYDDDLLSSEIVKVYKNSINSKFAMGSGIVENLDETDLEKKKFLNQ